MAKHPIPRGADWRSAGLVTGFATAVAMWGAGFFLRLPSSAVGEATLLPAPALFTVLVLLMLCGGAVAGRRKLRAGALAGLVTSLLNLLILGGALSGEGAPPRPALWVVGFLGMGALLGWSGALIGRALGRKSAQAAEPGAFNWPGTFGVTASIATFLLIIVGGLVTSGQAGLAVPDWPTSYEFNMFLFPLARMTGGVYLEHAHRLLGSLVGLTTVALAVYLWCIRERRWLRFFSLGLVVAVVLQGVMGGLRVTELSLQLAMIHGILGQIFLSLVAAQAVFLSLTWKHPEAARVEGSPTDRWLPTVLVAGFVIQLILGAVLRHTGGGLLLHMTVGIGLLVLAAVTAMRIRGAHGKPGPLGGSALVVLLLPPVQVVLGFIAFVVTRKAEASDEPSRADLVWATVHHSTGALVLVSSVVLMLWARRLVLVDVGVGNGGEPDREPEG